MKETKAIVYSLFYSIIFIFFTLYIIQIKTIKTQNKLINTQIQEIQQLIKLNDISYKNNQKLISILKKDLKLNNRYYNIQHNN